MMYLLILCYVKALPEAFRLSCDAVMPRPDSGLNGPEAWTGKWILNPIY